MLHTRVLAELFVDDNSNLDLDVADSLSYSNEQVCETGWHCSVEMTETFADFLMLKIQL